MVGWIERHAHTRYRINGEIAVVDARRDRGGGVPSTHVAVVRPAAAHPCGDRQPGPQRRRPVARPGRPDDQGRPTHPLRPVPRRAAQRARRPGSASRWRDREHGIAEIAGIPDRVLEHFSSRTDDVRRRLDEKLDRFLNTLGPGARRRGSGGGWNAKPSSTAVPPRVAAEDAATLHDLWRHELTAIGWTPERLVRSAVHDVDLQLAGAVDSDRAGRMRRWRRWWSASRRGGRPRSSARSPPPSTPPRDHRRHGRRAGRGSSPSTRCGRADDRHLPTRPRRRPAAAATAARSPRPRPTGP